MGGGISVTKRNVYTLGLVLKDNTTLSWYMYIQ